MNCQWSGSSCPARGESTMKNNKRSWNLVSLVARFLDKARTEYAGFSGSKGIRTCFITRWILAILAKDKLLELLILGDLLCSEISLQCKFNLSPEIAYFKYLEASRPMMVLSSNTVLLMCFCSTFQIRRHHIRQFLDPCFRWDDLYVSNSIITGSQFKHTVWLRYRAVFTLKVRRITLRFEKLVLAFDKAKGNNITF